MPPSLPSSLRTWTNSSGNGNWDTAGNWLGGIPSSEAHNAFFGNHWEGVEAFVTNDSDRSIGSLWFNAGTFYTLRGTGKDTQIKLKGSGSQLIVVRSTAGGPQSEHNINNRINVSDHGVNGSGGFIENYSEGGLRLGGDYFILGDRGLRIRGTGAIHLASNISGTQSLGSTANGNIRVNEGDFSETPAEAGSQPHLILSGEQPEWSGGLRVLERGFVIVKRDQALGRGSERHIYVGATLALRSHLESKLTYSKHQQDNIIEAEGLGIRRSAGTRQIGAIYNDGGYNIFGMRIALKSRNEHRTVGFGSRGDREGGLELTNQLKDSASFLQIGPGLIYLNNAANEVNTWGDDTTLKAGVLRIGNARSLAKVNLVFDGGIFGGILELGYGDSFTYSLGTGISDIRWTGDGGFSAFFGARKVNIGGGTALTWGQQYFVQDNYALLLSSRYANNVITFENAINLNSGQREVRVERGTDVAYAELSGALSGTGGGLLKTGDGLLWLTGSNTYTGATRIEAGSLRGAVGNTSSNIVLAGGVLGLGADFTRGLGGGGSQIQWDGSGGFAAYDADRSVTFVDNEGNPVSLLTWGTTGGFISDDAELRFGHYTADGTVLWDNGIALGSGTRTIHIEHGQQITGAVVNFRQAISGTGTLNLLGNGRIDLTADNSTLSGTINIYGAELRLHGSGKLGAVNDFDIRHGGTLRLNNTSANSTADRLKDTATITLAAGTLRLSGEDTAISEKIGDLTLESGANTIWLSSSSGNSTDLHINKLLRADDSRATLHLFGEFSTSLISFKLTADSATPDTHPADAYAIGTGDKIIPWATNGDGWLITHSDANTGPHFLKALVNYYELGQSGWSVAHNVKTSGSTITLGGASTRTINSLILGSGLSLNGRTLTLNSGGLMSIGNRTISGGTGSTITTASNRPLYIHNSGALTFSGSARLSGGMDVVKTRGGSFIFNSGASHSIGSLYIHQGTVELRGSGNLQIGAGDHRITIGDGAGEDRLILPGGRWNPITKAGGGLPSITLRGTPYDPRGPEYGGDQAILQLGGNGGDDEKTYGAGTKQRFAELRIEGRGTIDWRGGEVGLANILWIDSLTFSSTSDRLFIRNWYEYEDLFLVKKVHNGQAFDDTKLNQIVFEGYQDYFPTLKDYDNDYWQITPWGYAPAPEPATTGAILGAVGLGLVVWRKRKKTSQPHPAKGRVE